MVVSMKIRLLSKDTRFLPVGSDISDTCLRHSHLHESYAYYIAPTCWLPRELSSSVAGNNSKLLLLVICHPASAIIYVHRTIVFWPGGHFVCFWFQLYDARSGEPPPMPTEPKPRCMPRSSYPNESFTSLPKLNPWDAEENTRPSCWQSRRGLHTIWTKWKESDRDALLLWGAHPEGHVPHYSCLERGLVLLALPPLRPPPAAGQGGREKSLTWPPVKWACRKPLEIGGGTNAEEGETHASQSAMKCNLAPIGLGLQGASIDLSLQNNREGGTGRGWGMQRV